MRGDIGMQTTFSVLSDVLSGTPGAPAGPETCLNMNKTTFELIRTPFEDTLKEDNFSWRLGVNYKPNRDVLIYALASRGYKSGSFPPVPASTTAQFAPVSQRSDEPTSELQSLMRTPSAVFCLNNQKHN